MGAIACCSHDGKRDMNGCNHGLAIGSLATGLLAFGLCVLMWVLGAVVWGWTVSTVHRYVMVVMLDFFSSNLIFFHLIVWGCFFCFGLIDSIFLCLNEIKWKIKQLIWMECGHSQEKMICSCPSLSLWKKHLRGLGQALESPWEASDGPGDTSERPRRTTERPWESLDKSLESLGKLWEASYLRIWDRPWVALESTGDAACHCPTKK